MSHYERSSRPPNPIRDLSDAWARFVRVQDAPPVVLMRLETFCEDKRITVEALAQLEARYTLKASGGIVLAYPRYAFTRTRRIVAGIRTRDLDPAIGKSAMPGSRFAPPVLPAIIGDNRAPDWFAVEGETDGARLWCLTRGDAAIVVYGGTQAARYHEWDVLYPKRARVWVAFDGDYRKHDEPPSVMRGDEAAALLLERIPNSLRLRPALA